VALSVVQLLKIEGTTLSVRHIDCLDNTPLIDIKPYFASTDSVPEAVVGWHRKKDR
jgi:tRNA (Thr-GGU) A37 N-methylase